MKRATATVVVCGICEDLLVGDPHGDQLVRALGVRRDHLFGDASPDRLVDFQGVVRGGGQDRHLRDRLAGHAVPVDCLAQDVRRPGREVQLRRVLPGPVQDCPERAVHPPGQELLRREERLVCDRRD